MFRALARVELILWLLAGLALWLAGWPGGSPTWFWTLSLVLAAQQGWLLPRLDRRATAIVAGQTVPPSRLHHLYVAGECAKVLVLPALCWSLARALAGSGM